VGRVSDLTLVAALAVGCASVSRGGYIDPPPPRLRAGLLELQWRRRMLDLVGQEWRPVFRGRPTYDARADVIYVGSADTGLYAMRGRDGALLWRFETLGRVDGTPTLDRGQLYFGCGDGALYAIDATTGALRWRAPTAAEVVHAPIVIDETVYFVNANDTVLAVNRTDGTVRWRYRRNAPGGITLSGHAGLTRAGGRLYTGFADGTVVCLDSRDGSVLWDYDTAGDIENADAEADAHHPIDVDTTPVVVADTVYVASFTAGVYGLDATGGGLRWRLSDMLNVSALGTDTRYVYAASSTLGLVKLDPYDGSVVWARDLGSHAIVGATQVGDGMLAVPTADRAMWLVRTSDGEPVDGISPGRGFGALPTVTSGRLFVESNSGVFYAFRLTMPASQASPIR
jgi:outer membrane protein assembly factor BamB